MKSVLNILASKSYIVWVRAKFKSLENVDKRCIHWTHPIFHTWGVGRNYYNNASSYAIWIGKPLTDDAIKILKAKDAAIKY